MTSRCWRGLGRWSVPLLPWYLFRAPRFRSDFQSTCSLLRFSGHPLIGSFSQDSLANLLVIMVSSYLMYFLIHCIKFANVVDSFLLRHLKNSAKVVPFYLASTALNSSRFIIWRASALKQATYSHRFSSFLCLAIFR